MRTNIKPQTISIISIAIAVLSLLFAVTVWAGTGTTDSSNPPGSTSSYTLEDIYNRLNDGTAGTQSTFTEPSAAPGTGTMHTLDSIMAVAPAVDETQGAVAADVASDKTFWGLTSGAWGWQAGTGTTASSAAPVPKTGQTASYGTRDDGALQMGVAWPSPRFTINLTGGGIPDGTVTDNLTGLIWLQNANCTAAKRTWATALTDVTQLNTDGAMNSNNCGDTSYGGSHQTDWRLPNVLELFSLIDFSQFSPALPSGIFTGVQVEGYWSSTTNASNASTVWVMILSLGGRLESNFGKIGIAYVWPVRGGQ